MSEKNYIENHIGLKYEPLKILDSFVWDFCDLVKKAYIFQKLTIYLDKASLNLNSNIIQCGKLNISINSETSKPEEKSKRQKVIHFFCKFFHKSPNTSSSSSSGANNVLPVEPQDIDGEPPNFRDGAISLLKSRRGSSVRDVYLGKKSG